MTGEAVTGRRLPDGWGFLVLPLVAFLLVVFVHPLISVLARSLSDPEPGLGNYAAFFDSPVYLDVLVNTFVVAGLVTLVTLVLGFPYAYLMTLATPFWRGVLMAAVLVPFWTSLLVRTFAWVLILRDTGVVNEVIGALGGQPVPLLRNLAGVLIGMVQVMLPFAVLPIYATMRGVDRRLLQAAEGLGARPAFAFWRVYAPLTLPGVAAATLLVFVSSLGFYVTPALLGGPQNVMIGELIVQQLSGVLRWGFASALAVILLVVTGVLLLLAARVVDLRRMIGGGR
ncbi:putative spermidine/putrescine transport system permease protein [Nonomuraea maritima]|uniref:Putative spermidine/putrescine transport system permease protein n=1 Tax=Nonomuraea maritima TaxID=683260 RepID=A0A1G8S4M3_9ACTN|nr:ABC transporter permease [Nonomuraea maritima]SDJ24214.1 putative spermidine/putrescine transport system permease protein [Nonomuraea maritima]